MKIPNANLKIYTESDMNTMRALRDGCHKACHELRKLLRELNFNAVHYRGYSPVDLDDDDLFDRVERAISAPASKDPHEWVNKKRFDAGMFAHNELVDHHAEHHREIDRMLLGCQTVLGLCLETAKTRDLKLIIQGQLDRIKEVIDA